MQPKSYYCAVGLPYISPKGLLFLHCSKQRAGLAAYLCSDVEPRWSVSAGSENTLGSGKGGMALDVLDVPCFKTQISAQFWSKALLADLGVVHPEILLVDLGVWPVGNGWISNWIFYYINMLFVINFGFWAPHLQKIWGKGCWMLEIWMCVCVYIHTHTIKSSSQFFSHCMFY